ncbi:hypothetical protein [Anaeromyxobacter oryzisoli]|uniref:hypothetical protein n=1 Tax=Anaeromyxobacter oryzisoli TaxID=2925408 RepID=UPI001F59F9A7|nr:hypothetical protein [Anaeromyxobacter sp. SG63]
MIRAPMQQLLAKREVARRGALALLLAAIPALQAEAQEATPGFEAFEEAALDEAVDLGGGARVVPSIGTDFLYVIRDGMRLWKSPKAKRWFAMREGEPERVDIDGDGIPDVVWYGHKAHYAFEFGIFVSVRGGTENFLVHFDPHGRITTSAPDGDPLVTASAKLPPQAAKWLAEFVRGRWKSSSHDVMPFLDQLRRGTYAISRDPMEAYPELGPLHAKAVALFREQKTREARYVMDPFFDTYDFRQVDPDNRHPEFTAILNDYAFFLSEDGWDPETLPALAYVIERDPGRAVAYLNMADALCKYPGSSAETTRYKSLAAGYYLKYAELMTAAGKQKQVPKRVSDRLRPGACGPAAAR